MYNLNTLYNLYDFESLLANYDNSNFDDLSIRIDDLLWLICLGSNLWIEYSSKSAFRILMQGYPKLHIESEYNAFKRSHSGFEPVKWKGCLSNVNVEQSRMCI